MEKTLKNRYNWKSIILWSLVPVGVVASHLCLPIIFHFNDDITMLVAGVFFLFWGIISGLSYEERDSFFKKYTIVSASIPTLFIASVFIIIMFSLWVQIFDPIEIGDYAYKIFALTMLASMILPFLVVPFIFGFVIAKTVKFIDKFLSSMLAKK